jgi:hypothetical protein
MDVPLFIIIQKKKKTLCCRAIVADHAAFASILIFGGGETRAPLWLIAYWTPTQKVGGCCRLGNGQRTNNGPVLAATQ